MPKNLWDMRRAMSTGTSTNDGDAELNGLVANDGSTANESTLSRVSSSDYEMNQVGGNPTSGTNQEDGMELIEQGQDFETVQSCEVKNGHWICKPYKRELIEQQFESNSPGASRRTAIIGALRDLGVKVFIIEAKSIKSTKDILHHVRRVVGFVAKENQVQDRTGPLGFQRCLLYQDQQGRLFNLMMAKHSVGPAAKYEDYLDTFSGMEAMVAVTVLSRSFPCVTEDMINTLQPAYLSLVLGLVLMEEISLSWLNASMLIRAAPSVSAHALTSKSGSDILRKAVLFALAMGSAATGATQRVLTMFGIFGACAILLSNLGSRAWHFMRWKPLRYQGPGAAAVAYLASIATGMAVPYMGHRSIEVGGKAAMEHIIKCALVVGAIFVVSDIDDIQRFLVVGSENCDQDTVNIVVGAWWAFTLICSLFLSRTIPYKDHHPYYDGEPLLIEDHASPVGYKVPSVPDFEIDPGLAHTGLPCFSVSFELLVGIVLALGGGAGIVYLSFTSWDEEIVETLQEATGHLF